MTSVRPLRNILLVDLGATFGGAEVYLGNLVEILRGHFTCISLCSHPRLIAKLRGADIKCITLPCATGAAKVLQLCCAFCTLPYLILRYRLSAVQINGYAEIILLPLARIMGRISIATRHLSFDIEYEHWYQAPGRFIARFLYRRLARFATRIICVSREVGTQVEQVAPANRVLVIPNWVPSLPALRVRSISPRGQARILYVGRLVRHKGLDLLLAAIHEIHACKSGLALRLTIVGDGPHRSELEANAAGMDARFLGFQSEVAPYYEEADIFVNPSRGPEGSPLVILEAMAHSVPCLLSDLAIHREVSGDGEAAMLFRSGDFKDLAEKLITLVEQDHARETIVEAGYQRRWVFT